jgi:ATP-dependent helicase YprA (DUF1998 family)
MLPKQRWDAWLYPTDEDPPVTPTPPTHHFSLLSEELIRRASRAVVSQWGPASPALRQHLLQRFGAPLGTEGAFLAQPVFESLFDWELHPHPIEALPFLSPRLVDALDQPDEQGRGFAFSRSRRPRSHQFRAWEVLCNPPVRSVLVRTGTASGKTECFMVPVLNDLARELDACPPTLPLEGVRALFLYPLNALIHSQRNRLRAWCSGFHGAVRFALYNGLTPEDQSEATRRQHPEEVLDRKALRASPPPVLVTNVTMLEYMLVRAADGPIVERSKGTLRWIVLDEAHTYLGSAAAEIALLLRRVMDAFAVDPKALRFVATSATIGDARDEEVSRKLQCFLADLGGIDASQVEVIDGRRVAPPLPPECTYRNDPLPSPEALEALSEPDRYRRMASCEVLRELRSTLTGSHATLDDVARRLYGDAASTLGTTPVLRLLDLASSTRPSADEPPFLPLRGHFFARTVPGLWACCDRNCSVTNESLRPKGEGWHFGALYTERRTHCRCGALCFEVHFCCACGEAYLAAYKEGVDRWKPTAPEDSEADEVDEPLDDEGDEEDEADEAATQTTRAHRAKRSHRASAEPKPPQHPSWDAQRVLVVHGEGAQGQGIMGPITLHRRLGTLDDTSPEAIPLHYLPAPGHAPRCVRCAEAHRRARPLVRSAQLGTNFLLNVNIPTLLEQETPRPEDVSHAEGPRKPAEGRRLLTFSDSRQGSARFAMRVGNGAERNYVRAFVYHSLWAEQNDVRRREREEKLLGLIEEAKAAPPGSHTHRQQFEYQRELEALRRGTPISWEEMATRLAQDKTLRQWMKKALELAYPPSHSLTASRLAKIALLREFVRRPRRANSLETMGLVALDYKGLDQVDRVPSCWREAGFKDDAWRPFLRLAIDFIVRANTALVVDRDDFRWIGLHFSTPAILAPDNAFRDEGSATSPPRRYQKTTAHPWPSARIPKKTSRMQRYLEALVDPYGTNGNTTRETVDAILREAWRALTEARVLTKLPDGWRLDLCDQGRFQVLREAWLCPMTGRLLGTTLQGRSPYLHRRWTGPQHCEKVEMPALKYTFPTVDGISSRTVLEWLECEPSVQRAREKGAWNEFSDRLAAFAPTLYFRAGEHSAQQKTYVLEKLEKAFNEHELNVLSCSTTMEMGVDIGGLNTVAMNNVPPAPANYRQRAGRAGRSGAARATVLTLCSSSPHGEAVFRNPSWPFTHPVAVPKVSLDSRRIVARHVNALCLGRFFRAREHADHVRLECKEFFLSDADLPDGDTARSMGDRFVAWLRSVSDPSLDEALRRLTHATVLADEAPARLRAMVGEHLTEVVARWRLQREGLCDTLADLGGKENMRFEHATAAQRAALLHLRRHDEEYLLRYLTAEGFLPAHGFPMWVVPFVTTTKEQVEDRRNRSREDVPSLRGDHPTRHLATAIREYAPGASVTLNGMVYDSEGLVLAWKRPVTSQDVNEIQDLGWGWQCKRCGAADFTRGAHFDRCPICEGEGLSVESMLRPAGFAVDFYSEPHNDLSLERYVPAEEPYISAVGASWIALGTTPLGRFRHTVEGRIVYRNRGEHRHGYAVCLHCGRAAAERGSHLQEALPEVLVNHFRLRGGREKDEGERCPGNDGPYAIRRNVVLGGATHTDVCELQLWHPITGKPLGDRTVYTTLAVALRHAVAEHLGVDPREIGWALKAGGEQPTIVLYDTADGGAGYVSGLADVFPELIVGLRKHLDCPRACEAACHACLLGYDTQWHVDHLDRRKALGALPQELDKVFQLPPELQVLGAATRQELFPLGEAFERALQGRTPRAVRVHLGAGGDWEMAHWPMVSRLRSLSEQNVSVSLVLPEHRLAGLTWSEARELYLHAQAGRFHLLASRDGAASVGRASLLLELEATPRGQRWALLHGTSPAPGPDWGRGDGSLAVLTAVHEGPLPTLATRPVDPREIDRSPPEFTRHFEWPAGALSGPIAQLGQRFWEGLIAVHPPLNRALHGGDTLRRVYLRDRYVHSPLMLRVLYEVFSFLKTLGAADAHTEFVLDTRWNVPARATPSRGRVQATCALASRTTLTKLLNTLWKSLGAGRPTVHDKLHHDRLLQLTFPRGAMSIHLHQGISFLGVEAPPTIDLDDDPERVVKAIREMDFAVSMPESTTVHLGDYVAA